MTPLLSAAAKESMECLELLLSHGAEINIQDDVSNDNNMIWWVDNNKTTVSK